MNRPFLRAVIGLSILLIVPGAARALVDGERHALYRQHQVFGGAIVTGNTLMTASIAAPEVNSGLLPRSDGDVRDLPFDAQLEAAYLFWSGSMVNGPDRTADLTAADGTTFDDVRADRCVSVPSLGGFFYCRADVTARLRDHPGAQRFNGTYRVGDVQAEPGFIRPDGECVEPGECQAKYAAWSLVIVYSAPSARTLRDVFVYDGFRQLDETPDSPGIDQFDIAGFDFPADGRATLTYFALEGDAFLGVPPQDTDPIETCDTCYDFLEFSGTKLGDATNPPNNLFNSTSPRGFTLGLDLDTFDVSRLLRVGQQRARLRAGSGDGVVDIRRPDPGGGGESFFLGYVMLAVDRNAPNFLRDGTRLTVVPDQAAPRERVVITLTVENEGTLDARNVVARLPLPAGLTYVADSLRVDGADPVQGAEQQNPLAAGLNLGLIPHQGDNDRVITLRATLVPDLRAGTRLVLRGGLRYDGLAMEVPTNEAVLVVLGALNLGRVTKEVLETDGDGRFAPGELIQYLITIPNPNDRDVQDVLLTDPLPPYVDLVRVLTTTGVDRSDAARRLVRVEDMSVPGGAGGAARVTILARIHDAAQLAADGVAPGAINGFVIANQATVEVAGTRIASDDPSTAGAVDPTRFRLAAPVDIGGPGTRKTAVDEDGGLLEPGDRIRYTIRVENRGTQAADVSISDPLPARTGDCRLEGVHPELVCAGGRLRGVVRVGAGAAASVVFTVAVDADAPHGTVIENVATLRALQDAAQQPQVHSERLRVTFAPALGDATKTVEGAPGGLAQPGDRLRYVIRVPNTGNRAATGVVVSDRVHPIFADVEPEDGGTFDADTRLVTWVVPDVPPGAEAVVAFTARLPAAVPNGTVVANQGTIVAVELPEAVPTDDPGTGARDDATRVTVRSAPRLQLTKAVEPRPTARPGDPVTYTLVIRNTGTDVARDVVVTDPLPADVFAEVDAGPGRRVDEAVVFDRAVVPALAALDVGASVRLVVNARLVPVLESGLVVRNQARAAAGVGTEVVSDDPATAAAGDPTDLTIESTPVLTLAKEVVDLNGGEVQPGDRLRYRLTIGNIGDAPANGVVIADPVPPGLVDVSPSDGGVLQDDVVRWAVGVVRPGAPLAVTFEATVDALPGAAIANQATARGEGADEVRSDDPGTPVAGDPTVVRVVRRPDLSTSTKAVAPAGEVRPGEVVTWTIEVVNSGAEAAAGVVVTDALPAEVVGVAAEGAVAEGANLRWNLGDLPAGGRRVLVVTGRVARPLADGTVIRNQAFVVAEGLAAAPTDDPATPAADDATVLVVRSSPDLSASTKSVVDANGAPVRPGDLLTYALGITNRGGDVAREVVVTDVVPPALVVEDAGGAAVQGDTLVWRVGDLAPDAVRELVFTARVRMPLANGTIVDNQGRLAAANLGVPAVTDDPRTPLLGDPTRVQVVSAADLSGGTKTVEDLNGGDVRPGDRLRYTITVRNAGDDAARGLVVRDPLPEALRDPQAPGARVEGGALVWGADVLAPGALATFTFEATVGGPLADGTVVANQALLTARGVAAPFPTDDPATAAPSDPTAVVVRATARPTLAKRVEDADGPPFRPGDALVYTLEVGNEGDGLAEGLVVEDPLPAGLVDVVVPAPAVVEGGVVRWPVPPVAPGEPPRTLAIRARVAPGTPDGAEIANQARAGDQPSDDPSTPEPLDPTRIFVEDRPDLRTATKAVSGTFAPGGEVEYLIAIENAGTRPAEDVSVVDPIPAGLIVLETVPAAVAAGRELSWALGALPPGERRELRVRARVAEDVADGTRVANQAVVLAAGLLPAPTDDPATPAEDDATAFEVVARPILVATKTVQGDGGDFRPGEAVTYTLRIANEGNRPAEAVEVLDPLDAALAGAQADGGVVADGQARWVDLTIPPGGAIELFLRARIRGDVADGAEVSNQFGARAGAAGLFVRSDDPTTPEPEDPVVFTVRTRAPLVAAKTVEALDPAGFLPGSEILYTITLVNGTDAPVANVTVADPIDRGRLDDVRPGQGGLFDPGRAVVEWTPERAPALRAIAPGARVDLRVRARIAPALAPGDVVANQAQVAVRGDPMVARTDDPATPEAADPTRFTVVGGPALDVQKEVAAPLNAPIEPGTAVRYRIRVTNRGSGVARAPVFADPLPAEVRYRPGSTRLNGAPVPDVGGGPPFGPGMALGGDLAPNGAAVVEFEVEVRPDAPRGRAVANQGFVTDALGATEPTDDPLTPIDDDPTVFVVGGQPDLTAFVKRAVIVDGDGSGRARIGDVVEWRLDVTNVGAGAARRVRIDDAVPARTSFVAGSLTVDGAPVTDADDGDGGAFLGDGLRFELDEVAPRSTRQITFRTRVRAGPRVENQARLTALALPVEASDDDGDERNGDQPTVVLVGDALVRDLRLDKTVNDPTGAPALAGETLRWTLSARNEGTVALNDVAVVDDLAPGLELVEARNVPPGAALRFEPAPAGRFQNGRVVVSDLAIAAQARVDLELLLRVDPRLPGPRRLCNVADATATGVPATRSPEVCVDAEVRFGDLAGTAFQDLDRDGVFGGASDEAFAGMRVAVFAVTDPDGAPVAEAETDEAGVYRLRRLLPGRYRVRVFSATDVLLLTMDDVPVTADRESVRDLVIDPSGRVYDSAEGTLIDGAEVFIYRDLDLDEDPFDAETLRRRVLVPVDELEAPSQQGQRTAHGGLYHFAVRRPGRYLVEVVPPGPSFVSPSLLVPPRPGVAFTDDPAGRIVEDDLPRTDRDADRTYFLAFQLDGPEDEVSNNHIPIDPLSSLIDLQKSASRPEASVGDVVTYTIDVVNRSPEDLVFDPRTQSGGVFLQDVIPAGTRYVAGSSVLLRVEAGREIPLESADPTGARILKFGGIRREGGRDVFRPLDLHAGEVLRLKYQLVVGADAQPNRIVSNRAVLLADGNVPVTRVAAADLKIVADPVFDQGLVLGKVWCDDDADGEQTEGERGLPGVRVYMDHGYFAVTDAAGKFHFKDIDPGTHALKIDADTLLPGGKPTTDETRVVYFTRGLPAKVGFGVTCPADVVSGAVLELGDEGLAAALEALRRRFVLVTGNTQALRLRVGDTVAEARPPAVTLLVDGAAKASPDLPPGAGGVARELSFAPTLAPDAPRAGWRLRVGPLGGDEAVVAEGRGPPPERIAWNQRGPDGRTMLEPGRIYAYRLEIFGEQGELAGSPAGVFGVGASGAAEGELVASLRGDLFDGRGRPTRTLVREVERLAPKLRQREGTLVVEAHAADEPDALAVTRQRAEAARAVVAERLGRPVEQIEAVGAGNLRPLVPNLSERNRDRNRRVELRLRPPGAPAGERHVETPVELAPVARAGREGAVPDERGDFAFVTEIPEDGVVEVAVRAADGRRAVFPIGVRPGSVPSRGEPRDVAIGGRLPGELTLGGARIAVPALAARIEGPTAVPAGKPAAFTLGAEGEVAAWRFAVAAADGAIAFSEDGAGAPPTAIAWNDPPAGAFRTVLTVRAPSGVVAQSAPGTLRVGEADASPAAAAQGGWSLRVDGQPVTVGAEGDVYARLRVRGDEAVVVDVGRPDGSRVVFFARPPERPAAPGDAPAGAVSDDEPARDGAARSGPLVAQAPPIDEASPYRRIDDALAPAPPSGAAPASAPYFRVDEAPAPGATAPPADLLADQTRSDAAPAGGADDRAAAPDRRVGEPASRAPLPAAQRDEMARFGRAELLRLLAPTADPSADADVPARNLTVDLPPAGARLSSPTLPVRGRTAPGNKVFLNGAEVGVDEEGAFAGTASLPEGTGELEVAAVDPQGNRGVIRRTYAVEPSQWFLLAVGEGLAGGIGSELDGVRPDTSVTVGDTVYLHGRAAAYLKGRVRGADLLGGLFERYEVTAHLDTARQREFEARFRQLIDPETFYPVYGDASQEVKDANTSGPLYVLVRADASTLTVGNFRTGMRGIELFRYDRTLYGAQAHLDVRTGEFRHDLEAFAADLDAPERHAYVELRGTGGSLYYLRHDYVVEGSERVFIVERDRISGIERRRVPLARDADYTFRYDEGRLLLKTPLSSVSQDGFGIVPDPVRRDVLDGHPLFLAVEYDHQDPLAFGDGAFGVHARETWNDTISVGGGYIQETRADASVPTYKLWGAELGLRRGRRSYFDAELARSQSTNGDAFLSHDGGLSFEPFNGRRDLAARGSSFLLRGGAELDDFTGDGTRDRWFTEGYWQYLAPGFYSGGTIQEQGLEKFGLLSRYHVDERHALHVRHDSVVSDEPATQSPSVFRAFRRDVTQAGYTYTNGALKLGADFAHTDQDEGLDDPAFVTDTVAGSVEYQLDPRWTLLAEQEAIVRGDSRLHDSTSDLFTSTAGVRFAPTPDVQVELTESLRWNGDNATQLGMRTEIDDRHTIYVQQRVGAQDDRTASTTVVGGEERFGEAKSGRLFGEYQLEAAEEGQRNRAVVGVGKRTKLVESLTLDVAYERSQVVGDAPGGEFSHDTVSLGSEWLDGDRIKIGTRYELRYEDNDEEAARRDRLQFLTLNGASWKLTQDLTLLLRFNYSHTLDLGLDATEAELVEGSLGFALRPVAYDWVAVIAKYTKRFEQRPIDVALELPVREESDVVTLIPILELPLRLQLVEKLAWKRTAARADQLPTVISHTTLWINRLNYHLTDTWDAGVEYRFLRVSLAENVKHGALLELNYILQKKVRLGLGYNFTRFSDDEFARLDEDHGGPFFRVVAHY